MKSVTRTSHIAICVAVFCVLAAAQTSSVPATANSQPTVTPRDARLFPLEELRPGMKGLAYTVFSGKEPQEFGVEILGVLPGFPAPRQSAIIGKYWSKCREDRSLCRHSASRSTLMAVSWRRSLLVFLRQRTDRRDHSNQQMIDIFEKGSVKS